MDFKFASTRCNIKAQTQPSVSGNLRVRVYINLYGFGVGVGVGFGGAGLDGAAADVFAGWLWSYSRTIF
jgi:hypothetical protein